MKATVNRQLFMKYLSLIPAEDGASLLIADGVLTVASFQQGVIGRIPAYVIRKGQRFLNRAEWHHLLSQMENDCDAYIDIEE